MTDSLTQAQAYQAMFNFLQQHWELSKSDELGMLLGSISLQPDGTPADPAMWSDWIAACKKAV